MLDYIKGIVFVIVFIGFLGILGKKIKKSELFSENLIYGFVVYTCFQFVGGFLAQQFRLPWLYYQIYMIVMLIGLMIFSLYKNVPKVNKTAICTHFKRYGILYLIAIVFVMLAVLNIQYLWNANLVDSGYYLNKIKMAPHIANFTDYNYAVGISAPGSIIRNINTFEVEGAFYSSTLGIEPTIYTTVFLAFINYTLLLHVIYWFYRTVVNRIQDRKWLCIAVVPILFFGIYYELLVNYGILFQHDGWQFNTAMWFGSTFVRTAGFFILLTPLLDKDKITLKSTAFFVLTCVALFSKASQVFPVAILVGGTYIFKTIVKNLKAHKHHRYMMVFVVLVFAILIFLPIPANMHNRVILVQDLLAKNMNTIIIKLSVFSIALSYIYGTPMIKRWNTYLLLIGLLMFMPKLNSLFILSCLYDFVAGRIVTLYIFTLMLTASLYVYLFLVRALKTNKKIFMIYGCVALLCIGIPIVSIHRNLGIKNTLQILKDNPKLMPESTLQLGAKLEAFQKQEGVQLRVLMPLWLVLDGTPHPAASMFRYDAFDVISVGSIPRFKEMQKNSIYKNYTQEVQDVFEFYLSGQDRDDKKLQKILKTYDINCIVVYNDDVADRIINNFNYKKVGSIALSDHFHNYSILYKK